jgi:hypothetical protein
MKQVIPSLLIGLNNSIIIVVCLYLILSDDISFQERGIYAGSFHFILDGGSAFNQETEQFNELEGHYVSSQIHPANF